MTLEFEKLTQDLDKMARVAAQRRAQREEHSIEALAAIRNFRDRWDLIDEAVHTARQLGDDHVRLARPFDKIHPLDAHIPAPAPPAEATIIATDGSQIMPDRHAAYLYYLVNVGGIVYHHGRATSPTVFSEPVITYPEDDISAETFEYNSSAVSIERDKAEIGMLARQTWQASRDSRNPTPLVSILDQRLLYWPTTGNTSMVDYEAVKAWSSSMTDINACDGLLAGYIDSPGTSGVMTLLSAVSAVAGKTRLDWKTLGKRAATQGLTDADLFGMLLEPGERSKLFANVSKISDQFAESDPANRVCFFYLNPGLSKGSIARVDVPQWVAEKDESVEIIHALIIDQCRILGNYPYVLARADEMAVVGRQDATELNFMIDISMQRYGISQDITAKQDSKSVLRGGRTRHEGL